MTKSYKAIYHDELNYFYEAQIFVSSVTLTMRYHDPQGRTIDRNWLGADILSMEEDGLQTTIHHRTGEGKPEKLVVRDPELVAAIRHHFRHRKFTGNRAAYITGKARYKVLAIFLPILAFFAILYFMLVPWLGEQLAKGFSREREISIGDAMYTSMVKDSPIDERKTRILNSFYKELTYQSSYPVQVTVIRSKEINAFAMPGGHIVVYDGILQKLKTPSELAALLGHESSHVELRHSLRNIFRSTARKIFLMMVFGGDASVAGYLANRADDLKGLEYSRDLETEADNQAMMLMARSGVDLEGMLRLMQVLQQSAEGKEPSSLLSTHPVFETRIANIRSRIPKIRQSVTSRPNLSALFDSLYESANSY